MGTVTTRSLMLYARNIIHLIVGPLITISKTKNYEQELVRYGESAITKKNNYDA